MYLSRTVNGVSSASSEQQLGGDVVGHPLEHRVVAAAQHDVLLAGVLGDHEAALVEPLRGRATEQEPRDRGAGEQQHRQGDAADQHAAGMHRLHLAAARGAGDEGGDEAASAEGVGLDEVLLGGHRSARHRGDEAGREHHQREQRRAASSSRRRRPCGRGAPTARPARG